MGMCREKKHKISSKIIALVIMQAVILSGLPSAYCGESLRQKTDNLSPHINIGAGELQKVFDLSTTVLSQSSKVNKDRRALLGLGLKLLAAATIATVVPGFVTDGITGTLSKDKEAALKRIKDRLHASEAAKKARTTSPLNEDDARIAKMWKRIDSEMKLNPKDAYKNAGKFLNNERIGIYRKLQKLLKSTDMPVDIIMALDLAETDLKDKANSGAGARGPMQVMPGTVKSINKQLAIWKKQGDKRGKYREEYLTAVKLIGSHKINWSRVDESEYGRRVGITVAYLSYVNISRIFKTKGLVYSSKTKKWQFVPTSNKVKPYMYFSTAVLNAAYNGRGEGMVLKMIRKYGPVPLKVYAARRLSAEEQAKKYFDPQQKIGWLEGNGRGEYNDETRTHFLRLWRYYNAIQEYKQKNPSRWAKIVPDKKFAIFDIGNKMGIAFASIKTKALSSVTKEQEIGNIQNMNVNQSI